MSRALPMLALALAAGACAPPVPGAASPAATPTLATAPGQVRHVVVFKYKPGADPERIRQVTQAFAALRHQIPGIVAFEHGVNHSPEGANLGFTHVHLMTFTNAAARDAYLPHPAHRTFGELLGRLDVLESAFVVDYTPQP